MKPILPTSCSACFFLPECGGVEGQMAIGGCFSRCSDECATKGCDNVCPYNRATFLYERAAVGGFRQRIELEIRSPELGRIPKYLPVIYNGYKRRTPLSSQAVAIPLWNLLRCPDGRNLKLQYESEEELRRSFLLSDSAKIVVLGSGVDQDLENLWYREGQTCVFDGLKNLGVAAVTSPNFSFFTDTPRPHTLFNFRRITLTAELMARSGLPVVLHLNALTDRDWNAWADIISSQSLVHTVAKEFQTGLIESSRAHREIACLARLQDKVGRDLHVIAIGGSQHVGELYRYFKACSVTDATPFMKTFFRRAIREDEVDGALWEKVQTHPDECLDALLAHNIVNSQRRLFTRLGLAMDQTGQQLLGLDVASRRASKLERRQARARGVGTTQKSRALFGEISGRPAKTKS